VWSLRFVLFLLKVNFPFCYYSRCNKLAFFQPSSQPTLYSPTLQQSLSCNRKRTRLLL
jgi:hypothetical protein